MDCKRRIFVFIFLLLTPLIIFKNVVSAATSQKIVIGVNLVNEPHKQTPEEQEATLQALNAAGVVAIRCGIPNNKMAMDFVQRVSDHGIKILWLAGPTPFTGTPWPKPPEGSSGFWKAYPLSKADPDLSRTTFEQILGKLEEKKIVLAGIEVGNEFNWAGFNADFVLPGSGRVLNKDDLTRDKEGKQIAQGLLQYVKVVAALKDVRDHSHFNKNTPIIVGGLADCAGSEKWLQSVKADLVSVSATLEFLREHGIDDLVDGYGIHCYPHTSGDPGTPDAAAKVRAHIELNGISECKPYGSKTGKQCWFTEWGVDNKDENNRSKQVGDIRKYFRDLAASGSLKGMFFYNWQGNIHAQKEDGASAFRGGKLSDAGKLAISPL